jgi:hypothetical protein
MGNPEGAGIDRPSRVDAILSTTPEALGNFRPRAPKLKTTHRDLQELYVDVVVAGVGIIGLLYTIYLKNISPGVKIEVFEKKKAKLLCGKLVNRYFLLLIDSRMGRCSLKITFFDSLA